MSMMCEGDKIKDRVVDAMGRQEVIIREREKEANTILCGKVLTVEKQKKTKNKKLKENKGKEQGKGGQMIIKGKQQELCHPYSQWLEVRKGNRTFWLVEQ